MTMQVTSKMKMKYVEMTAEFARLNGRDIPAKETGPALALLRIRLIWEELGETITALHEKDLELTADGLADLMYVVVGTAATYGVDLRDDVDEPHRPPSLGDNVDRLVVVRRLISSMDGLAEAIAKQEFLAEKLRAAQSAIAWCSAYLGLPLDALFREVHSSNMTKTPFTEAGAKGGLKSSSYRPPDIAGVLAAARRDKL